MNLDDLLRPLTTALRTMVARATISLVKDAVSAQTLQVEVFAREVQEDAERFAEFGFASWPPKPDGLGATECILLSVGGDRAHGVVVATHDRRHKFTGALLVPFAEGDAALHDSRGQYVHLAATGLLATATQMRLIPTGTTVQVGGGSTSNVALHAGIVTAAQAGLAAAPPGDPAWTAFCNSLVAGAGKSSKLEAE